MTQSNMSMPRAIAVAGRACEHRKLAVSCGHDLDDAPFSTLAGVFTDRVIICVDLPYSFQMREPNLTAKGQLVAAGLAVSRAWVSAAWWSPSCVAIMRA